MKFRFALSFVLFSFLFCYGHPSYGQSRVLPPYRPYKVDSYRLSLDWRRIFEQKTQLFTGENKIAITLTDTASSVALDVSNELWIDSVQVGTRTIVAPQIAGDTVFLRIANFAQPAGSHDTLDVFYKRSDPSNDGIYFYPKGLFVGFGPAKDSVFVDEDLAYTMSEPNDARKWMPCNDNPSNKSSSAIRIIVPSGYSAQSNGTLQSVDSNSDGSVTYNWVSDRPIATYLMCADASHWMQWQDYYHRLSDPADSVPVVYFAWPTDYNATDTTGLAHNAHYAFRNTPKMIENDSRLFGEYPFRQYGQVPLQPFGFGGMEHQTMTSLDRSILHGNQEDVIAHELFHQWFGDKTTCETWADIWLNEGFATLGEALWEEYAHGESAYDHVILNYANDFLNPGPYYANNIPTYNPPVDQMFGTYVPVVYWKPGCMLHMLRRALGNDTVFFNTLRDYSSAFAYTTANTFQFRDFIAARDSARSPIDLKEFINEWIFQPDYPIYNITWNVNANNVLRIEVDQLQDSTDHYTMPLQFFAIHGSDTTVVTFVNNARTQFFTTQLSSAIDNLSFDQEAVPVSTYSMSENSNMAVRTHEAILSPLRAIVEGAALKLTYAPVVSEGASVRMQDVLGHTVASETIALGSALAVLPLGGLPSGNYFATLADGARNETVKFHWEK